MCHFNLSKEINSWLELRLKETELKPNFKNLSRGSNMVGLPKNCIQFFKTLAGAAIETGCWEIKAAAQSSDESSLNFHLSW